MRSPKVVTGESALNAADAVVCPVPPFAIGRAVPLKLTAKVPDVVIGEPDTDKNEGTVIATLVTVPDPPPPAGVAQVPSPRQKVVEEAPVPEPKLFTERLPVT
jgi:hypothetical protein